MNLIVELIEEMRRVEHLSGLDDEQKNFADKALRSAKAHLAMNSYEGMREALEDLRAIGRRKGAS